MLVNPTYLFAYLVREYPAFAAGGPHPHFVRMYRRRVTLSAGFEKCTEDELMARVRAEADRRRRQPA